MVDGWGRGARWTADVLCSQGGLEGPRGEGQHLHPSGIHALNQALLTQWGGREGVGVGARSAAPTRASQGLALWKAVRQGSSHGQEQPHATPAARMAGVGYSTDE